MDMEALESQISAIEVKIGEQQEIVQEYRQALKNATADKYILMFRLQTPAQVLYSLSREKVALIYERAQQERMHALQQPAQSLEGQIVSVTINQSKLISKYRSPIGGSVAGLLDETLEPVKLATLGLRIEHAVSHKCDSATIFDGNELQDVMGQNDFKRVMPISPAHVQNALSEIEALGQLPLYVLCIPIKVFPEELRALQPNVKLDDIQSAAVEASRVGSGTGFGE
ncbi:hypothetical protein HDU81_007541 [Chytriomyces hyalinus]|nr:hypothetical protein HDU81_007541 [Chytriomyces hyalinus]